VSVESTAGIPVILSLFLDFYCSSISVSPEPGNNRLLRPKQPVLQAERLILEKKQITAITEISQSMSKNFFGKSDSNVFLKW